MTTQTRDFDVISADSRFTEPADLWERYIEPQYRARAPHVEHRETTDVFVCDTADMFSLGIIHGVRYKSRNDIKQDGRYADVPSSGWDPNARILEIQKDGIYGEVLYPTIAMRFFTIKDVAFGDACVKAYNSWAADFCKQQPKRFKAIGISFLDDIDAAVVELTRMKKIGLGGAMIAVFPDEALPYWDPHYDKYWAAAADLGLPVSLHVATERRVQVQRNPVDRFMFYNQVQRVCIGLIYAGVFDRYPKLQVVSAENDAGWAGNIIERMDYSEAGPRRRKAADLKNQQLPSHYWRNNVSYSFMRDQTAILARSVIGVDRLLWSSDFPHIDSTYPDSQQVIAEHMHGVPMAEQRLILRDNARRLYGF